MLLGVWHLKGTGEGRASGGRRRAWRSGRRARRRVAPVRPITLLARHLQQPALAYVLEYTDALNSKASNQFSKLTVHYLFWRGCVDHLMMLFGSGKYCLEVKWFIYIAGVWRGWLGRPLRPLHVALDVTPAALGLVCICVEKRVRFDECQWDSGGGMRWCGEVGVVVVSVLAGERAVTQLLGLCCCLCCVTPWCSLPRVWR